MDRFIVTGASGYLGRKVSAALLSEGHRVLRVDIKNADYLCDLSSRFIFPQDENYQRTHLVHLAAKLPGTLRKNKLLSHSGQISHNLLKHSGQFDRILIMSTTAVYKTNMNGENLEVGPWEAYGQAKLQMEKDFISNSENLTILRPGTILGPDRIGGIVDLLNSASRGKPLIIPRQGDVTHPFVHVDDVVNSITEWSNSMSREKVSTNTLIASNPISISEAILRLTGRGIVGPKIPDVFFKSLGSDNFPVKGISKWHLGALLYNFDSLCPTQSNGSIPMIETIRSVLKTM